MVLLSCIHIFCRYWHANTLILSSIYTQIYEGITDTHTLVQIVSILSANMLLETIINSTYRTLESPCVCSRTVFKISLMTRIGFLIIMVSVARGTAMANKIIFRMETNIPKKLEKKKINSSKPRKIGNIVFKQTKQNKNTQSLIFLQSKMSQNPYESNFPDIISSRMFLAPFLTCR